MNIFRITLLGLSISSVHAFAGDEVHNGSVVTEDPPESSKKNKGGGDELFCMTDPSTSKEVCVAKEKKDELKKKLKDKKAPPKE